MSLAITEDAAAVQDRKGVKKIAFAATLATTVAQSASSSNRYDGRVLGGMIIPTPNTAVTQAIGFSIADRDGDGLFVSTAVSMTASTSLLDLTRAIPGIPRGVVTITLTPAEAGGVVEGFLLVENN